jgi:hypothetical protein
MRYVVEIVEAYELCPWTRATREAGEIAIEVLWNTPADAAWIDAARGLLSRPDTRVAMVVAPELAISPVELRRLRDRVAAAIPGAGVADFHPEATLDLGSPARLVPFLRRTPDPVLQLVPHALLDAVRSPASQPGLAAQAQMLGGHAAGPRASVAERIAATNHARVARDHAALAARHADIVADRAASYARAGIKTSR